MDSKSDDDPILMDASALLDTPLLQVTHDEEIAQPYPTHSTTTATAVDDNDDNNTNTHTIEVLDQVTCGEKQPNQFRDPAFAVLFVGHLAAVSFFAFAWGFPALQAGIDANSGNSTGNGGDGLENFSLTGILGICLLSTLAAGVLIFGALGVMICHADKLIQGSLVTSIAFTFGLGAAFAVKGLVWMAVLYFVMFLWGGWYAYAVWPRLPFATSILVTATTAIKANMGVTALAFGMALTLMAWFFVWTLAMMGVYSRFRTCDATSGEECDEGPVGQIAGLFLMLSFYWSSEVVRNLLQVVVAGVVGTFWFAPHEANSFWSPAILDSFGRATSYSFGSICLGSLVMAIIQLLRHVISHARNTSQRNSVLLCILECIVSCLERLAEYFNKFAYAYIGLYGYDYLTAGKKVIELFKNRGWETIIADNIILRTFFFINFVVGALTGCVGLTLGYLFPSWVGAFGKNSVVMSFTLPFLIGISLSNVLLGVIASATDTVIICFAEGPNDFHANYPELSQQMRLAWRQIYPEECGF